MSASPDERECDDTPKLTATSAYQATGGSPTAWGAGTEITVAYLGPH